MLNILPRSFENLKYFLLYGKKILIPFKDVQSTIRINGLITTKELKVDDSVEDLNILI